MSRRGKHRRLLTDHFSLGVAEQPFSPVAPCRNQAVEGEDDDGIIGGLQQGSKLERRGELQRSKTLDGKDRLTRGILPAGGACELRVLGCARHRSSRKYFDYSQSS